MISGIKLSLFHPLYFDFTELLVVLGEEMDSNTDTGRVPVRARVRAPCNLAGASVA